MASNGPKDGHRYGAITGRSQVKNPKTGLWTKRDTDSGEFMSNKVTGGKYKGVRKENDEESTS
jgi:hypothetical protein